MNVDQCYTDEMGGPLSVSGFLYEQCSLKGEMPSHCWVAFTGGFAEFVGRVAFESLRGT